MRGWGGTAKYLVNDSTADLAVSSPPKRNSASGPIGRAGPIKPVPAMILGFFAKPVQPSGSTSEEIQTGFSR